MNRYTEDSDLDIDNNLAERVLRIVAIGRRNWLFTGRYAGAERAAIIYSLIASRKLCEIEINDWSALFKSASYLIFDGNKCVLSGEWEPANPNLVWLSGTQVPIESFNQAVSDSDIDLVKSLLSKGADVNARDRRGRTVLHIAASNGYKVLVELLIAKGADINAKGSGGGTALHGASRFGHRDVVELLIAKGADINAKRYNGQTPLSVAKEQGHEEVAEILRQHGGKE